MVCITNGFNAKLSDQDVYKILHLYHCHKWKPYEIEPFFNVTRATIKAIVNNKGRIECNYLYRKYLKKNAALFDDMVEEILTKTRGL